MRAKYLRCGPVGVRLDHRAHRPGGRVGGYRAVNLRARHVARVLRFFPPTCTIPRGRSVGGGSHFGRTKRRLFPLSLSIQAGSNKRTTGGFNIPVGWARSEFEERAVNRLEPLRGFQHPRSSSSGVRAKRACPCLELKA